MGQVELGIDTFGDVTSGPEGRPLPYDAVLRNVVEEGVLADQVGLDVIGIGEHHRADFAISAPDVVLAAIAARTSNIRLASAVTVLSSDDPVRVFERFATLDAISGGRAEVILGRGSFTESFPLFGYDLADYDKLFDEKLDLSRRCCARSRSPGRAPPGHRCAISLFTRRQPMACGLGSEWAATPNPWSEQPGTDSR
jgi:alkanesulfonate monooxygenase SsuD/methylene tetrahydromethanopterin reductase-like flavin-dependent oxidoreductase (luciferase family)